MICQICNGMGSLFVCQKTLGADGKKRSDNHWYTCPACGGAGANIMHGPAALVVTLSGGQRKVLAKAARAQ